MYGGPIHSIATLCESLVEAGNEVTVYTTTANGKLELDVIGGREYLVDGVRVFYFTRNTKGHSNFSIGLLKRFLATCKDFEIVHLQSWWNLVIIPSALICLSKGIYPIVSLRGTLTDYTFSHRRLLPKRIIHALLGRRLLSHSSLHVTSEREGIEASRYVQARHVYTIPNMLELPSDIYGSYQQKPYLNILFLGRIDPAKNLEMLFRVLSQPFSFPFQLIVAGDGPPDYIEKLKGQTNQTKEILWIGKVEGEQKFKLLGESDLLILPSHTENFGNVVIEALSQGTPVMVSSNVGAKDYVLQHQLGWVIYGGENEWRKSIEHIWNNKAEMLNIRNRAAACIAHDFNRSEQVKSYMAMYLQHQQRTGQA